MSRQNYYKSKSARSKKVIDVDLIINLVNSERKIQPMIGGRKLMVLLQKDLADAGVLLGRDLFFGVLSVNKLLIKRRRRGTTTTDSRHFFNVYKNLLKDFDITSMHEVWVSDITYIRTTNGFMYLSLITDLFSRKVVGYNLGDTLEAEGCINALKMAQQQLPEGKHPIHHSDRGMQYCCNNYIKQLKKKKQPISMTEENHCYENAAAERINGILKYEYGLKETFKNKKLAMCTTKQAIALYNNRRPHMSLNYKTPEEVHSKVA